MTASALRLEERVSADDNPFPMLTSAMHSYVRELPTRISEFLVEMFGTKRKHLHRMQWYEEQGRYLEAAYCAVQLKDYLQAFTFYEAAAAHGDRLAYNQGAELAESLGDYQRAEQYRLQMGDLEYAGEDALRRGRSDLVLEYWRKLAHEKPWDRQVNIE